MTVNNIYFELFFYFDIRLKRPLRFDDGLFEVARKSPDFRERSFVTWIIYDSEFCNRNYN